ncbi:hypothetical protein AB0N05_05980 [Nocardia sp. NPDC051030]|uniref:hypothetical protein n=1 Tax=Nocardia sp. NPDC051030 TaxID=3155162 RepID=UPI0034308531
MGIMGELFPGQKLQDDGSGGSDGQLLRPVELDLDSGVIRVRPAQPTQPAKPADSGAHSAE